MIDTVHAVGTYLIDLLERMELPHDPGSVREVLEHASGGQLNTKRGDGRQASTLTLSGLPFEASVTGGRGRTTRAVRYVTEPATQETTFESRLTAQRIAVGELVRRLASGGDETTGLFRSLIEYVHPEPALVPTWYSGSTFIGVVYRDMAALPVSGIKVYCGPLRSPAALEGLCRQLPGFAGLATVPEEGRPLLRPLLATLEANALGEVVYKVYMSVRPHIATPMKLVRYFGDPAWEILSELVACGADPTALHRYHYFICRARGPGASTLTLNPLALGDIDLTEVTRELATRHHGSTHAVDAMAAAARAVGAAWHYSALGVGFSADHGIDKLNVYGVPIWSAG
ncbi:hypothetical protein [Nocardia grenadensis]|uniref:hypothetical protein n=1 Tax=Nocardia grenadensis TaxID=931537 RepID=UPI0007A40BA8|nr:hypothetical protein [Nocardia grenadensis]